MIAHFIGILIGNLGKRAFAKRLKLVRSIELLVTKNMGKLANFSEVGKIDFVNTTNNGNFH